MLEPNLICERGHKGYSPVPQQWITRDAAGPFCTTAACGGMETRVRIIGGEFLYESPHVIRPPAAVEEEWSS